MPVTNQFQQWGLGYGGCDGGDPGSPDRPAIWVCGIEWGGGHGADGLRREMDEDVDGPPTGYDDWQENISYPFNWNAMKLLGAIDGYGVDDYKEFARTKRPFVHGISGYFKLNLFPISFRNTDPAYWAAEFSAITGFSTKEDYLYWCRTNRMARITQWTEKHQPEMVLCFGKTWHEDFGEAFAIDPTTWVTETIDGLTLRWAQNKVGTLVMVVPFIGKPKGLLRNTSIQKFGSRIAQIRHQYGLKR